MRPKVYLAGPITNCDRSEANDWRDAFRRRLVQACIEGVSPLRCEPLVGDRYGVLYTDPRFGTARAIASKNFFDVQRCDLTLAYMPAALPLSKGTLCELAWGFALRKPTILVSDDASLIEHPVVQACAGWTLDNLEDAYDVITGVLG